MAEGTSRQKDRRTEEDKQINLRYSLKVELIDLMIDGLDVENRERKKSRITFQISGLNNWADRVLFIRKEEIGCRNSLDSSEEQNSVLDMLYSQCPLDSQVERSGRQ